MRSQLLDEVLDSTTSNCRKVLFSGLPNTPSIVISLSLELRITLPTGFSFPKSFRANVSVTKADWGERNVILPCTTG